MSFVVLYGLLLSFMAFYGIIWPVMVLLLCFVAVHGRSWQNIDLIGNVSFFLAVIDIQIHFVLLNKNKIVHIECVHLLQR